MKIYTKTGDEGTTGLLGGHRVAKDDPRIEAYGTVDELNALLGVARSHLQDEDLDAILALLQDQLFALGAALASPEAGGEAEQWINAAVIEALETTIDEQEQQLEPLTSFILPAGSPGATALHTARAVCRRAERRVVTLHRIPSQRVGDELIIYLNRVGDLLFVLSRVANLVANKSDVPWHKPG